MSQLSIPTSIAGSLPKPDWLSEPRKLWPEWKLSGEALRQALGLLQQRLRRRYTARLDAIEVANDLNSVEMARPPRD